MEDVFGPSFDECERRGQKSKFKVTRDKKLAVHSQHPAASTEWNALTANNVRQEADAAIPSLPRGDFTGLRALGLAGYRWALPSIASYLFIAWFLSFDTLLHFIFVY